MADFPTQAMANAIRALSMDAVETAKSMVSDKTAA